MNMLTLTQRLAREVRAEAGRQNFSQTSLAEAAGLNRLTLRRYFYTEEREIPMDAVFAVAGALGIRATELMKRAEDADPLPAGAFSRGDLDLAADVDPDAKADEG